MKLGDGVALLKTADPAYRDRKRPELTKYAGNAFLAMKVTFINEMADLCEKSRADVHDVPAASPRWPHRPQIPPSWAGYGGSCFPRTHGLCARRRITAHRRAVEATVAVNDARKSNMAMR